MRKTTVRLTGELHEKLCTLAQDHGISLAGAARLVLSKTLLPPPDCQIMGRVLSAETLGLLKDAWEQGSKIRAVKVLYDTGIGVVEGKKIADNLWERTDWLQRVSV